MAGGRAGVCIAGLVAGVFLLSPVCPFVDAFGQQAPAPIERRAPQDHSQNNSSPGAPSMQAGQGFSRQGLSNQSFAGQSPPGPSSAGQRRGLRGPHGEHLAVWLNQHSNLNLQQQQQALGQEPGFHDLPPETQQRYRNRLAQLDAMNPQRRQNILARNEAMERLSPDQRAQVRGALGQLGGLPQDQRHVVAQTFRSLRDLPPNQRFAALNSGRFGTQLNPAQRDVLNHLLIVEPMLPPPSHPAPSPSPYPQGSPQPMDSGYPR